jgi:aryl-alcohol dehydrogenase-like predicted oxidoreductase
MKKLFLSIQFLEETSVEKKDSHASINRREFIKLLTVSAVGGKAILFQEKPPMTYRRLGRTGFMSSRLVFGGGAALAGGKAVRLLDRALEAGINHFDLGSNVYYRGAERSFAPFLKINRRKVWVASKAPPMIRVKPEDTITVEQAKSAAASWTKLMDASLKDLGIDYIDLYYLMAVDNPSLISSEEINNAFLTAKKAGKVGYFGLSTHKNAHKVLETAIKTGWYDVAMLGVTPAGWYDWEAHDLLSGTPVLKELEALLKKARTAGIGLVGMKAVRHLAPKSALGKGDPSAFDKYYHKSFMSSPLTPFQRAYAYVLEHGLDVVNADMQNFKHLEENIIAAATSQKYFA